MKNSDRVECDLCKTKMKVKDIDDHIKNSPNHIGDLYKRCIVNRRNKKSLSYLLCNYPVIEGDYGSYDPLDETIYKAE